MVVFLCSFISALFLYFFQLHPYLKPSFSEIFSRSFFLSWGGGGGGGGSNFQIEACFEKV